jgi:16S rRNA (guanine(1405)-N(7))-methyltransferase
MDELDRLVESVQANAKYRVISQALVRKLGAQELSKGRSLKDAVKATRNKLHQIGGAYQEGGISYDRWLDEMLKLPADLHHPAVMDFCRQVMAEHASTKERLPILDTFFTESLSIVTPVQSILDVACGLNPLALPWMPTADGVEYFACDIYIDLVDFLNQFFQHFGVNGRAWVCDLTVEIPDPDTQVAFVLKTLPCLEQVDKTVGNRLLPALKPKQLLVSFPARSLGGRSKGMPEYYEAHFNQLVESQSWKTEKHIFQSELAFLVQK